MGFWQKIVNFFRSARTDEISAAGGKNRPSGRPSIPESSAKCYIAETTGPEIRYDCGHIAPAECRIFIYGETYSALNNKNHCPECRIRRIRQQVVRCSSCGRPIMPSSQVALYAGSSPGLKFRNVGIKHRGQYIGCMRADCCPSGGFFAGHWSEDGFVSAFEEGATLAEEMMCTGRMITPDDNDPNLH